MATINVKTRLDFKEKEGDLRELAKRFSLEEVELSESVEIFRTQVASKLDCPTSELELIYCGCCLRDNKTLESYGVTKGSTVHVLRKRTTERQQQPEAAGGTAVRQLLVALQSALLNPAHREIVQRVLSNPVTMESVIAATPGLASDQIALALLRDGELLMNLADPAQVQKIVTAHPCLVQAATLIATAVNEEAASGGAQGGTSSGGGGLFGMDSEEEDMETADQGVGGNDSQAATPSPITPVQLASALATAAMNMQPQGGQEVLQRPTANTSGSSSATTPTSSTNSAAASGGEPAGSRPMITQDLFSQAMQQALTAATQSQLQQMREMGITDDALSLRALQATGGDVQAALELIFGDGL
ncbi:ubiquitin-like protein 7 isoform X1 [Branchiostoma floridae x Branchiostoma japonicum]